MTQITIQDLRGTIRETTHSISAAVVNLDGNIIATTGTADMVTFMRSAAKPLQALPLLKDGVAEKYEITDRELALACASHNSEDYHVEVARNFLSRLGFSEDDLACGPHRTLRPELPPGAANNDPKLIKPSRIASNCSGKHAGMLALAKFHGWEPAGYHLEGHPVQHRCLEEVADWCDYPAGKIDKAVDGCGVVTCGLPLTKMALGYARLVGQEGEHEKRIVSAMTAYPELVAGTRRLCTDVMRAYPGRVIAKMGAGGVYLAAMIDKKLGIALKAESGSRHASQMALVNILSQLGLGDIEQKLPDYARPLIYNTRGELVGHSEVVGGLDFT